MWTEKIRLENEKFIEYVLQPEKTCDVFCKLEKIAVKRRFIDFARERYSLPKEVGIQAYHRALAQVRVDVRLRKVSLKETHLESLALQYGRRHLYEQKFKQGHGRMPHR
jgi:hypothetical protein